MAIRLEGGWITLPSGQHILIEEEKDTKTLLDRAVKRWGTTNEPKKSGYLLPDGRMLNMASEGSDRRDVDHSAIAGMFYDDQDNKDIWKPEEYKTSSDYFQDKTGAIRMHVSADNRFADFEIHTAVEPTDEQWKTVKSIMGNIISHRDEAGLSYDIYDAKGMSRVDAKFIENAKPSDLEKLIRKVKSLRKS